MTRRIEFGFIAVRRIEFGFKSWFFVLILIVLLVAVGHTFETFSCKFAKNLLKCKSFTHLAYEQSLRKFIESKGRKPNRKVDKRTIYNAKNNINLPSPWRFFSPFCHPFETASLLNMRRQNSHHFRHIEAADTICQIPSPMCFLNEKPSLISNQCSLCTTNKTTQNWMKPVSHIVDCKHQNAINKMLWLTSTPLYATL